MTAVAASRSEPAGRAVAYRVGVLDQLAAGFGLEHFGVELDVRALERASQTGGP
jgi:hypothetical protein